MSDLVIEPRKLLKLPDPEYRAIRAVSKSALDHFNRSPAHYKYVVVDGNKGEPSTAMQIGSAFDTLIFDPKVFNDQYAEAPDVRRGTKEWKAFEETVGNKTLLKPDEWKRLMDMQEAVWSNKHAGALLKPTNGDSQVSYVWFDQQSEMLCKGRADFVAKSGLIMDLKTTSDASPAAFKKSIHAYRYFVQAAMYIDAARACGDETPEAFVFIAVEKEPPYCVATYVLDEHSINVGRALYQAMLQDLSNCYKKNEWPGYTDEPQTIGLPNWSQHVAYQQMETI